MRFAVLFVAAALVACQPPGEGAEKAPPAQAPATEAPRPVRLLTLAPRAFSERIEVTGTLKAPDDVTVAARGAGTITYLRERGERVEAGDVIARVDPALPSAGAAQAAAQVSVAEAGLRLAEDTLKRQKPLFDQGIVSALEFRRLQAQVDQARAQHRQAQAVASQARTQVAYTTVEAPFGGVIEERFCERGGQLAPGAPVVRLVSSARLKIDAGVPERYARDVRVGDEARVSLAAYQLPPRQAAVTFVGQAIDPANRTFSVEFNLDNTDGALKPEMTVRVILNRAARADALVVPQTAIVRDVDGASVFVVADGVARQVKVEVGGSADGECEILEGLEPGMQVVVRGQANLTTGTAVRVDDEAGEVSEVVEAKAAAAPSVAPASEVAP